MIGRQFDGVAVRTMPDLVGMEDRLHPVGAGPDVGETRFRITKDPRVEDAGAGIAQSVHVDPENLLRVIFVRHLVTRLAAAVGRDDEQEPTVAGRAGAPGRRSHDDAEAQWLHWGLGGRTSVLSASERRTDQGRPDDLGDHPESAVGLHGRP